MRRWLAVGVVLVLWGLITHGTHAGTGDEPHYQMIAHSLAFDRDLDLADDYDDPANLIFDGGLDPGDHARPGRGGYLRPAHDIGMPIVFAPYYAVAYRLADVGAHRIPQAWLDRARLNGPLLLRHLLSFGMIAITTWMALRLFDVFSELSGSRRRAALWAALIVLSPPILSHAFLFFTEILSAAVVLGVLLVLRRPAVTARMTVLAGLATGYLLLIHARNVGLVAGLVVLALFRFSRRDERMLLWRFLAAVAVTFALRTGVTFAFWGTVLTTPHARMGAGGDVGVMLTESLTRFVGWLFDQSHGLLPVAPIYLLIPYGWIQLWRRNRNLCLQITVLVAAYVVPMALPFLNPHGWRGGWSPAARFLLPIAPLLAVLVFSAVAWSRRAPVVVMALAAVQIAIDVIVWQEPKLLWNDVDQTSALYTYLDGGSGMLTSIVPLLVAGTRPSTVALLVAVAAGWLLAGALLARSVRSARL